MDNEPKSTGSAGTEKLSRTELRTLQEHAAGEDPELSLLLYHREGVQVVPLHEGQSRTLGRGTPSDVIVQDPSLSRQHAVVTLEKGSVLLEDLSSTNGTWVGGQRVERAELKAGVTAMLGSVLVTATRAVRASMLREGVDGHERFVRDLGSEIARLRSRPGSGALLLVRAEGEPAPPVDSFIASVRRFLRPFDRVGYYSHDTLEVLLPECDESTARNFGWLMTSAPPGNLVCGIAVFPEHAASLEEWIAAARAALRSATSAARVRIASQALRESKAFTPIARSQASTDLLSLVARLAPSPLPVLVLGETGVGKEVIANTLHSLSPRAAGPLVCVNCACIPAQLVESTLFGHEKGAFTGATQQSRGVFESADQGTVFLDEIGELPLAAQAALLRALETHRISRVGSTKEIEVDVRVVAATHRDLEEMVATKLFRKDLLYRLNALTLKIAPLRERLEDIEPLARQTLQQACEAIPRSPLQIPEDVLALLQRYAWPGNVRELRNAMERAAVIARGEALSLEDLPEAIRALQKSSVQRDLPAEPRAEGESEINLRAELERYEAKIVTEALERCAWDRKRAAAMLGLPLRTLSYRLQVLGIRKS